MQINLRSRTGEVFPLSEKLQFVEIVDPDRGIAYVAYIDKQGVAHVIDHESPKAAHYAKTFNTHFFKPTKPN